MIASGLLVCLDGCLPCNPSLSPELAIQFSSGRQYRKVVSVTPASVLIENNPQNSFVLPVWVGSEKMTFVFSNESQQDTLTISYSRRFLLRSTDCGYVYEISNLQVAKPTSFKNIISNPTSFQLTIND
ncbi:MAG: DUF6452 family protein [Bacteroidota bacterium]|jgi:hypothetical protein|nr:DUF6452 family protein [Cytophagales bacterium]